MLQKKPEPVAVPLDSEPERCTMTMKAQDFGPAHRLYQFCVPVPRCFQIPANHSRQWGRETSAPRPYVTDPFPYLQLSSADYTKSEILIPYIGEYSHCVIHVVDLFGTP